MSERKFTDEEVIKAFECHTKRNCGDCPMCGKGCADKLIEVAHGLINRQKAEIEKVKSCLEFYLDENEEMGIVFIPKFVVEKRIKEMTEGKDES